MQALLDASSDLVKLKLLCSTYLNQYQDDYRAMKRGNTAPQPFNNESPL